MAAVVVVVMLLVAGSTLFHSPRRAAVKAAATTAASGASSTPLEDDGPPRDLSGSNIDYDMPAAPRPPRSSTTSPFGMGQAMSAFFIYRTVMHLGNDGTGFSVERAMANAKQMDMMTMGILAFSVYNFAQAIHRMIGVLKTPHVMIFFNGELWPKNKCWILLCVARSLVT
jgi:hypothetical protein